MALAEILTVGTDRYGRAVGHPAITQFRPGLAATIGTHLQGGWTVLTCKAEALGIGAAKRLHLLDAISVNVTVAAHPTAGLLAAFVTFP